MRRRVVLIIMLVTFTGACSEVKPWDRDLLADPAMQLVASPIDSVLDEHIFFSKEASSGGQGVGGGGCGCN